MKLGSNEIINLIPHRSPFLFIDECEILEKGKKGVASRVFKDDEFFFKGHFPGNPIVPGVIIVEALAQTAGVIVSASLTEYNEKAVLFMSINKAKFRKPVKPNENLSLHVKKLNQVKNVYKFLGSAKKNDQIDANNKTTVHS